VTKTLVRAPEDSAAAERLGCRFGQAVRGDRELVVGAGPDEWLILSPPGRRPALASGLPRSEPELVTVVDVTHAGVLLRLSGPNADQVLAKVCSIDLSDAVTPSGRAFRSSVARLACLVIRDDTETIRSYLIHGDRSSGQYLVDTLLGVGGELGIDMDGFPCGT
jgi:heterotetrameric sarcosine oxidase gamma subunit